VHLDRLKDRLKDRLNRRSSHHAAARFQRGGRRLPIAAATGILAGAILVIAPAATPNLMSAVIPAATAAPCPDVEVVFARGRMEPTGGGQVGNAFVKALRSKVDDQSIGYYAVDYPANVQVLQGADDMSRHIQKMAADCPDTRLVLGGYSLGAGVTDVVLAVPGTLFGFYDPLPFGMSRHVAAVALFGNATRKVLGPFSDFSPLYGDKTIDLCHASDPICANTYDPEQWQNDWPDHSQSAYISSGLVDQAADFAAARL